MATRSFISVRDSNGSVRGVYCHWDGYPEGVGATLNEHYTALPQVEELLSLGSLSALGPTPTKNTVAYHRDRGEDLAGPIVYATVREMLRDVGDDLAAEHAYVFEDGVWSHHAV